MAVSEIDRKIQQQIMPNRNEMVQTLSQLVQIPSVTGNELQAQKYMQQLYTNLGLRVNMFEPDLAELDKASYYNRTFTKDFRDRPNVVGLLDGSPVARSINLNGHIDTVPVEPLDQWIDSPYSGKVTDNRLFGRGALDNKGGLVANYFALKSILDAGYKPKGTVMLESAVEEENGGAGSLSTLLKGYVMNAMVCNDGPPGVLIANTGSIGRLTVRVKGLTMHSGWSDYGVNAIIKMNKIVAALDEFGNKRTREHHVAVLETPVRRVSCTHNIGIYRAGDNASTVPGWAEIVAGFTVVPGEDVKAVRKQIDDIINRVADEDEWMKTTRPEITWLGKGSPGWLQDEKHPFVNIALECTEKVTGKKAKVGGMTAGSDARFSTFFNIPAILTGPVGISHAVNEYVEIDSLLVNIQIIAAIITEWCGLEKR